MANVLLGIPLPSESVQCVVTSPPYWSLRDYGTAKWVGGDVACDHSGHTSKADSHCPKCGADRVNDQLGLEQRYDCAGQKCGECYVCRMVQVFREVRRVLRQDGTLWLNLGDSYSTKGRIGTGTDVKLKHKDLLGIPWRVALALQADGWYLRQDIIWYKPSPLPESVTDRCVKSCEYLFLLTKSATYYFDAAAIREAGAGAGRSTKFRSGQYTDHATFDNSQHGEPGKERGFHSLFDGSGRNKHSVWTIPSQPYKGAHRATFPEKLVEPCILAGTSEHGCCVTCGAPWARIINQKPAVVQSPDRRMFAGVSAITLGWKPTCVCPTTETVACVVLDPFCGTGTVGLVCGKHGREFTGFDLSPEYLKLAEQRCHDYL